MIHNQTQGIRRSQGLKLVNLLKEIPNFQELVSSTQEQFIVAGNLVDERDSKEAPISGDIVMQAKIIESTWNDSPEFLKQFITATIAGNISSLRLLVDQYNLGA